MKLPREGVGVIHDLENVHADDAVERIRGDIVRLRQVGDEGRLPVFRTQIEDVDPRRSFSSEPAYIPTVVELQTAAADAVSVGIEKPVDIVPVNRSSALMSE